MFASALPHIDAAIVGNLHNMMLMFCGGCGPNGLANGLIAGYLKQGC